MLKQVVGLLVVLGVVSFQAAEAYTLDSLEKPLPVISGVMLNTQELKEGTDFHASLLQAVTYEGMVLPDGTQFIGHVQNVEGAGFKRRPTTLDIWIDQVVLPNGTRVTIYPFEQKYPHYRHRVGFFLGGQPGNLIEPGERLQLHFQPATLKGIFNAAVTDGTQSPF